MRVSIYDGVMGFEWSNSRDLEMHEALLAAFEPHDIS